MCEIYLLNIKIFTGELIASKNFVFPDEYIYVYIKNPIILNYFIFTEKLGTQSIFQRIFHLHKVILNRIMILSNFLYQLGVNNKFALKILSG